MFLARRPRASRSLFVVVAAVLVGVGLPAVASAEDPASSGDTVVGELVRAFPEFRDHDEAVERGDEGPLTFVRTTSGGSVRVATDDVEDLPTGATVELTVGRAVSDEATKDDGYEKVHDVLDSEVLAQPSTEPAPTSPAVSPVNHRVSVVMAVPLGGARDSTTLAQVTQTVNDDVAGFWSEQTDGAVKFGVTASRDWVNLGVGCSDPYALWRAAATAVGFTPAPDAHLVVYLGAGNTGCSDGLGTVGWDIDAGGSAYVRYSTPSIIAHELGHNLGLRHSSKIQCDNSLESGTCRTRSYFDLYDVMGASWDELGSLNVAQADQLGVLALPTVQTMTWTSPTRGIPLDPVSQRAGTRAIRLVMPAGEDYWLEYRPSAGRDDWLGTSGSYPLEPGVLLRRSSDSAQDGSLLYDGSPKPATGWNGDYREALPVNTDVLVGGAYHVTVTLVTTTSATVSVTPISPITTAWQATGGSAGRLGARLSPEACGLRGDGCAGEFEHGVIAWSPTTGARIVEGAVLGYWTAANGIDGVLGYPSRDAVCGLVRGGCAQEFQGGSLYWSPATGAFATYGVIRSWWLANGAQGALGYPSGEMTCDAVSCSQPFEGALVVWSPATGVRTVYGDLRTAWVASGAQNGPLRLPTSTIGCGMVRGGCGQQFQGGSLYWSAATGAHPTYGAIRSYWMAQGWESGPLGYANDEMACGPATCAQSFQGGLVVWSPSGGARVLFGAMRDVWTTTGGESGPLRAPTTEITCGLVRGGCGQDFLGGSLYWSAATGAHPTYGAIRSFWIAQGRERGSLGYPAGEMTCGAASCQQSFEGGLVVWSPATGSRVLYGAMLQVWTATGGDASPLGLPVSDIGCGMVRGGCGQQFQNGSLYWSAATGAHPTYGAIRSYWMAQGWERGPLGYAAGEMTCDPTSCRQAFEGGVVSWTADAGVVVR